MVCTIPQISWKKRFAPPAGASACIFVKNECDFWILHIEKPQNTVFCDFLFLMIFYQKQWYSIRVSWFLWFFSRGFFLENFEKFKNQLKKHKKISKIKKSWKSVPWGFLIWRIQKRHLFLTEIRLRPQPEARSAFSRNLENHTCWELFKQPFCTKIAYKQAMLTNEHHQKTNYQLRAFIQKGCLKSSQQVN